MGWGKQVMYAAQNYLYIVFAVIYIIYSIIKAGKKVVKNRPGSSAAPASMPAQSYTSQKKEELKPVQPPVSAPVPGHSVAEDLKKMMEDLLGGTPDAKMPEARTSGPVSQPSSEKPRPHRPEPALHPEEMVKHTLHTSAMAKAPLTHDRQPASHTKIISKKVFAEPAAKEEPEYNFDIQQAVIYSEILKRPQW